MIRQLRPSEFSNWRDSLQAASADSGRSPTLPVVLDVREPWELQTASVTPDGFTLICIPMRELPARLGELPPERAIACLCHHGTRSLQVAQYLLQNGFAPVVNLQGGIAAWSHELDPLVPQY